MGLFGNKKNLNEEVDTEQKKETYVYTFEIDCKNCGENKEHDIDCGMSVKTYMKNAICENCECKLNGDE